MNRQWTLCDLNPGESALVKKLIHTGSMRRRLLDLGLTQGTQVTCVGHGPGGDPHAYLIRGAVIALRARDSCRVEIQPPSAPERMEPVVALAGNPNVGKSTVFNGLTGMKQHTGNWPGKTVSCAWGRCTFQGHSFLLADLPGTYSLMAHSAEEEAARQLLCFGEPEAVIVVCDASCLERSLNLVLQILELTCHVVLCVNLMDEAQRKQIQVDLEGLSEKLGIPVVGTTARKKKSLQNVLAAVDLLLADESKEDAAASPNSYLGPDRATTSSLVTYPGPIEEAISCLEPLLAGKDLKKLPPRWLALRLLEEDPVLLREIREYLSWDLTADPELIAALAEVKRGLILAGLHRDALGDQLVSALLRKAEAVCQDSVRYEKPDYLLRDRKLDAVLTSRRMGYPLMLLFLTFLFWLTITGANLPSRLLSQAFSDFQEPLNRFLLLLHAPDWLRDALVLGVYRVLTWVVSVMLPPMAIFFPLFTLLEDSGYLPRIAYNLDHCFLRCQACGKQALTMAMGFGCNAVGVTGCRIIDSPRERLLALLTNSLVPCNGRFPALITLITLFFAGAESGGSSIRTALLLAGLILLSTVMTLAVTRFLSHTLLKGVPSSFTLELPPYRRPQTVQVLVRSVLDRTLFVLGRAVCVAAPAGLLIWFLANVQTGGESLLLHCSRFLEPFARFLGLDGTILLAFILGFPANEIVIPVMLMAYTAQGTLIETASLPELKALLLSQGWTRTTALCTLLLFLFHWPCSTTLLTIRKETGSWTWTTAAFLIPTALGFFLCALVSHGAAFWG